MKIKTEERDSGWYADCLDLPGSSPIGTGETEVMAVACLLVRMKSRGTDWFHYVEGPLEINGELWREASSLKEDIDLVDQQFGPVGKSRRAWERIKKYLSKNN